MSWERIQGQWHDYKGQLRQRWGELTVKDLDDLAGARQEELSGKLQRIYGMSKEQADREVKEWIEMEVASKTSTGGEGNPPISHI